MNIAGIVVVAVFSGALAVLIWRWGTENSLPALARLFVGVGSGGLLGLSVGVALGMILGMFLGLSPGTLQNEGIVAICLGFLGLVLGALGGLLTMQRMPTRQP